MADLPEIAQWTEEEDGIYQLELVDFITGGAGGNDNEPHRLLANRTRFLKERQDDLIEDMSKIGGIKNLWINGAFNVWDGLNTEEINSGELTATNQPRYPSLLTIMRHHTLLIDGTNKGVGGSYLWNKVVEYSKNWLRMTHSGSVGMGYIGQRYDVDTLKYLKGKTVTVSFKYKANANMEGSIYLYNEQQPIHNGIDEAEIMGTSSQIEYIGDGAVHFLERTIHLSTDTIVPDKNGYIGINIAYGSENGIPDGYIQFTEIQLEVNDAATSYEFIPKDIDRERIAMYYRRDANIFSAPYVTNRIFCQWSYGKAMRIPPTLTYNKTSENNIVGNYSTSTGIRMYFDTSATPSIYIYNIVSDARIY